ncbi:MAG: hypothetical protein JWO69_308 [Thermoleophilia bacterium]|nr:hypothetical protein [Thermoleophilia bacterium]
MTLRARVTMHTAIALAAAALFIPTTAHAAKLGPVDCRAATKLGFTPARIVGKADASGTVTSAEAAALSKQLLSAGDACARTPSKKVRASIARTRTLMRRGQASQARATARTAARSALRRAVTQLKRPVPVVRAQAVAPCDDLDAKVAMSPAMVDAINALRELSSTITGSPGELDSAAGREYTRLMEQLEAATVAYAASYVKSGNRRYGDLLIITQWLQMVENSAATARMLSSLEKLRATRIKQLVETSLERSVCSVTKPQALCAFKLIQIQGLETGEVKPAQVKKAGKLLKAAQDRASGKSIDECAQEWSISWPMILRASAVTGEALWQANYETRVTIDLEKGTVRGTGTVMASPQLTDEFDCEDPITQDVIGTQKYTFAPGAVTVAGSTSVFDTATDGTQTWQIDLIPTSTATVTGSTIGDCGGEDVIAPALTEALQAAPPAGGFDFLLEMGAQTISAGAFQGTRLS